MECETKVIAMYLPQYHRIPENDMWWGEGFTDWEAVKKATPLFDGHRQPKMPYTGNYYDLLDKSTLEWQSNLMRQYGIDGMCFYHYCFKENKMLLEQPAEILLDNKGINMPFCFCWANESWVNSWSNINNSNVWSYKFEKEKGFSDGKFLVEQDYGTEKQWKEHFEYLKPFFSDRRYICIDNKPVFLIYKPNLVPCLDDMKICWDKLAIKSGFDGIYLVGANYNGEENETLSAYYFHEPLYTKSLINTYKRKSDLPFIIDYDDIWSGILGHTPGEKKTFLGGFVSYDDTPRHECRGTVILNDNPEKFKYYFSKLIAKNIVYQNELTFINAWNEWGEGMYLEPDEENRFGYLEAVLFAKQHYVEYLSEFQRRRELVVTGLFDRCRNYDGNREKDLCYISVLDKWRSLSGKQLSVQNILEKRNINSIAIYGAGKLGKHLWEELKNSDIEVVCVIDKNKKNAFGELRCFNQVQDIPQVDAIIIAVSYDAQKICYDLQKEKNVVNDILTLEELIGEGLT